MLRKTFLNMVYFKSFFSDCLLPVGFENRKLPYSALTVSSYQQSHPAQEARLWTGRGWCLPSKASGKKEYLQIDLGAVSLLFLQTFSVIMWLF